MRILVIGAGIAGLTAARQLHEGGHQVVVVDKGRGPGGRVTTRHVLNDDAELPELTKVSFDHGAQYFTVRDARFEREVDGWQQARVIRPWTGVLASFDSEGREAVTDEVTRWVGVPGMSAIGRHLAAGLDVRYGTRITGLSRDSGREWSADASDGAILEGWHAVIVSVPAAQAISLVGSSPALGDTAASVRMHACWTVLLAYPVRVATRFDAAWVSSSPLGWIARNASKPHRGPADTWVLHASPAWSDAHADDPPEAVGPFLLNAFGDLVRAPLTAPARVVTHRWRFACADAPLGIGAHADAEQRLVVCGDWCSGGRIEGAFVSGLTAAALAETFR